ncbi:MAG: hypothetical protein WCT42_00660, partial [Candidatus Paceibacterota bacterium]
MEFKPQIAPNQNIDQDIQQFNPDKFLDWNPFNYDMTDICFTSIEESRDLVNNKIRQLQERVQKYLNALKIKEVECDNTFNQLIKDPDTNRVLQSLGNFIEDLNKILRTRLPEAEVVEREEWIESFDIIPVNQMIGYN